MKKLKVKKGTIIVAENSPCREMYAITAGSVTIYKTINAEKIELARLKKNDFFGEMCLLLGGARTATVEALEDTELLSLTRESLLQKIQSDSKFAERMLMVMAKRLKEADNIISNLEGEKRSLKLIYGMK